MAFSKALRLYHRETTISVDCGSFSVEINAPSVWMKAMGTEQARLRSEGLLSNKAAKSTEPDTFRTTVSARLTARKQDRVVESRENDEPDFFLGTKERDQRFFAEHVMVSWQGLMDDDGNEVAFSADTAMELFASPGGDELYSELLIAALTPENFIGVPDLSADAKN